MFQQRVCLLQKSILLDEFAMSRGGLGNNLGVERSIAHFIGLFHVSNVFHSKMSSSGKSEIEKLNVLLRLVFMEVILKNAHKI